MYELSKIRLLLHILNWRLHWGSQNIHYPAPDLDNPKFVSPYAAASQIPDGSVIATSGLAANQWAAILHWAIRASFENTGHPRNLTVVAIGGQGARGRVPGSLEELGLEGLCTRFFGGHLETFKSYLRLADAGKLELQCIPQGVLAHLIDGQGRGEDSWVTDTGVGTFVDPRVGRGTPLFTNPKHEQWVSVEGDKLRFRLPKIDVAIFNAPAADRHGNIYLKNCAIIAETFEIIRAARKNGGQVIANVGLLVEEGYDRIAVPAEDVDTVVYYPGTEQVASVPHRSYMPLFTTQSDMPREKGIALLRFVNEVLRITPVRRPIDTILARLAASLFAESAPRGSLVNIGVGLPEEVCRVICEAGLYDDIKLFTESGVIGGLPAPGVFFGTAVCPEKMISSLNAFKMCAERLDVSILGVLQADSEGNVNVSKRGEGAINYVGPGGFIDFSTSARTVIFVTSWMFNGKIASKNGRLHIDSQGKIKFVDQVDEITFSGKHALNKGTNVFFVTSVGVFQLTEQGMMLIRVMPGIDIQNDILRKCSMRIVLPESEVPVVASSVVTGKNFRLNMKKLTDSECTTEPWAGQTGFII